MKKLKYKVVTFITRISGINVTEPSDNLILELMLLTTLLVTRAIVSIFTI